MKIYKPDEFCPNDDISKQFVESFKNSKDAFIMEGEFSEYLILLFYLEYNAVIFHFKGEVFIHDLFNSFPMKFNKLFLIEHQDMEWKDLLISRKYGRQLYTDLNKKLFRLTKQYLVQDLIDRVYNIPFSIQKTSCGYFIKFVYENGEINDSHNVNLIVNIFEPLEKYSYCMDPTSRTFNRKSDHWNHSTTYIEGTKRMKKNVHWKINRSFFMIKTIRVKNKRKRDFFEELTWSLGITICVGCFVLFKKFMHSNGAKH
jgi:hypothetical protein